MERDIGSLVEILIILSISTHTLTWSVTWQKAVQEAHYYYFNSHAHVERDRMEHRKSIAEMHFNSHAHVERDIDDEGLQVEDLEFQLTRSRGAWRLSLDN